MLSGTVRMWSLSGALYSTNPGWCHFLCRNGASKRKERGTAKFLAVTLLLCASLQVSAITIEEGEFSPFAIVGGQSTSNDEPAHIVATRDDVLIIGGTTSPLQRGEESDLGEPLVDGLKEEDFFLTRVSAAEGKVDWVFRGGTSKEDRLEALLLDKDEKHIYAGGRSFGQFRGTARGGQSDIFIIKYDISGDKPTEVWSHPLVIGSKASDALTAFSQDPRDDNVIYGTGYTSGNLFPGKEIDSNGLSDAILFSFSASDGTVVHKSQFGTKFADQGTDIVLSDKDDGPVFVAVITERQIGQYAFGNFHMYKKKRDASPLGDLLLRTYSREQMASFRNHPMLPGTLIASGSSWLDSRNGYDVFVKRVVRAFDSSQIGSKEVDIDEVSEAEYTRRLHSEDGGHDYASGMIIDPESGRLILSGYTAGAFAPGASKMGILAPFVAVVDPLDATLTDAKQMKMSSANSWVEISCITMAAEKRGIYYVAKESNETTNQFHLSVGSFGFPASWKNKITIAPSPDPTPSPKTGDQDKSGASVKKRAPLAIIIGSVCGGVVLILVVVATAVGLRMKKRSKAAKVYDPDKKAKPSKSRQTQVKKGQEPSDRPNVEGSNATGLV